MATSGDGNHDPMEAEADNPGLPGDLQQQAAAAMQQQHLLFAQAQAQAQPQAAAAPAAAAPFTSGQPPPTPAAAGPSAQQPAASMIPTAEQLALLTQLAQQFSTAQHTTAQLSLAAKLAKAPPKWQPSQQSWADYVPTLHAYFAAQSLTMDARVWPALTFLPASTQAELDRQYPGLLQGPSGPLGNFTWAQLDEFCRTQQVAHMETDLSLHAQLARQHQYNSAKNTTTPLATHLEHVETFFPRFDKPITDSTKIYFVHNSLHPAVKPLMALDPTGAQWPAYRAFRAHLIASTPAINQAIAQWRPNSRTKRPYQGGTRADQPADNTYTQPFRRPRRQDTWTPEQRAEAAAGNCTTCHQPFTPGHRCENQARAAAAAAAGAAGQASGSGAGIPLTPLPLPSLLPHPTPPLLLPIAQSPSPTTHLPRGEEASAVHMLTNSMGVEQHHQQPTQADQQHQQPTAVHQQPTDADSDTDSDSFTLDELIEAYVAFDTVWEHEKQQQANFILAAIDRARRDPRQRRQHHTAAQHSSNTTDRAAGVAPPDTQNTPHTPSEDRRFIPSEFDRIKAKLPHVSFTLDACANPDGSNALCGSFCSTVDSFLTKDLANQTVWLNPPFARARDFLTHYWEQKQLHPEISAVIVLPKWRSLSDHPLYKQLTLLQTYPKGYHLFDSACRTSSSSSIGHVAADAAVAAGTDEPALTEPQATPARQRLPGIPWPVQVWYDPPAPLTHEGPATQPSLPMAYKCRVQGQKATVLLDTGAEGTAYLSKAFCAPNNVTIEPLTEAVDNVELANGQLSTVLGTAVLTHVQLQGFHLRKLTCLVLELTNNFDLVLASDWLVAHKAIIDMGNCQCTLFDDGGKSYKLTGQKPSPPADSLGDSPPITSLLLSHIQLKRQQRKPGNRTFVTIIREVTSEQPSTDERTQALLTEYADIFRDDIPPYDPTKPRDIHMAIPLEPGAKPPSRPMFRYSPKEYETMQQYVTELLEKGLIQPSSSPYGACVIFVLKPDGSYRMVIDYRALNRITLRNQTPIPRIDDLLDKLGGSKYFTALDMVGGYYQIPIAPEDMPKTAFKTPMGLFEFKVLPQGLTNSPAVFQTTMNKLFQPVIGKYVLVYLDDILVFSKTLEEHEQHIRSVLDTLRQNKYYCKPSKCHFFKTEVKYLGHIVSQHGISVDPQKIAIVKDWPTPQNVHELRAFLGLANYFRRFIQGYSAIALPLTNLLKHDYKWGSDTWTPGCQQAFNALKHALITAPILQPPDFNKPFTVVVDASEANHATGAVLMQEDHVIAYDSKKFSPAEENYTVTEKELLAAIRALDLWRCYLEGPQFTLVTDHNPNTFFHTQAVLNRRQARWSDKLAQYNFEFKYVAGRSNVADPLSRAPHASTLGLLMLGKRRNQATGALSDQPPLAPTPVDVYSLPFVKALVEGYTRDPRFQNPAFTADFTQQNHLWWKDHLIVVPNDPAVQQEIFQDTHASPYAGHFGVNKTMRNIQKHFWWPNLKPFVLERVRQCDPCQRNKSQQIPPAGPIQPLPIPAKPWDSVGMDFVGELPLTRSGYNHLLVFVDRLTKMVHLAPTTTTCDAVQTAQLFVQHVFAHHGTPTAFVHDRGTQFTAQFFQELCKLWGIQNYASTAYHPRTNGQTERMNRVIEDTLRHYISPTQDDWDTHLPLIEFAINNSVNASTRETPFYLVYHRHPNTPFTAMLPTRPSSKVPGVTKFTQDQQLSIQRAQRCMHAAQQRQKAYADKHTSPVTVKCGDYALLSTKNIPLKHPGTNKLVPKWIGPFKVLRQVGAVAFQLELPDTMSRLHPVFHASLLKPYFEGAHSVKPPPPTLMDDGSLEYEVEAILDMRQRARRGGKRKSTRGNQVLTEYLIKWLGYSHEHNSWEPAANLHCPEILEAFLQTRRQAERLHKKLHTRGAAKQTARAVHTFTFPRTDAYPLPSSWPCRSAP